MKWRTPLIVVALCGLLIAYYLVHKPIHVGTAAALGGAVADALTAGLMGVIAGGIGRRALSRLPLGHLSTAEALAVEGSVGLGLIAIGVLMIGLAGGFRAWALWGVLMVVGLFTLRQSMGWWRSLRHTIREVLISINTPWSRFLGVLVGIVLGAALMRAFAPPTAWDALAYHLTAPREYLAQGSISAHPENFFLGFSQNGEMLFGLAMSLLGRDTSAAPVHALWGLLGLCAVGGIVRRYLNRDAALTAILCLLMGYSFDLLFGWAYVDLMLFAYGAAALVIADLWWVTRQPGALITLGAILGLAVGTKYVAVGLVFALLIFVIGISWGSGGIRLSARNVLLIVIPAGAIFAPWALKGLMHYGNPVYPFFFNGLNWDAERSRIFATAETSLLEAGNLWQLPVLPIAATIFGIEKADTGSGFFFTAGVWLLSLPWLIPLVWRWLDESARRLTLLCAGVGIPLIIFWMVFAVFSAVGTQTRLMLFGFPVAAAACGIAFYGLGRCPRKPLDLGFTVRTLLTLTAFLSGIEFLSSTLDSGVPGYLFSEYGGRDRYLAGALGTHYGAMEALRQIPPGSVVRLMWEPRSYYCPAGVTCLPDVVLDHWIHPLRTGGTPEALMTHWRESGEGYLLVFEPGFAYYLNEDTRYAPELNQFKPVVEQLMRPVWSDGGSYTLYQWR